jgi:hypothetical protein
VYVALSSRTRSSPLASGETDIHDCHRGRVTKLADDVARMRPHNLIIFHDQDDFTGVGALVGRPTQLAR